MNTYKEYTHNRWVTIGDWPAVMEIEGQLEDPWPVETYRSLLDVEGKCIGVAAELRESVAGVMLYRLKPRMVEIIRLATREDRRRLGVASQLIAHLKGKIGRSPKRHAIEAIVPERRIDLIRLFARNQFESKLLRGQFGEEDGIRFLWEIAP